MFKIQTYMDDCGGVDLTPQLKPRLLFKAWLNHGPGHDEDLAFYVGPDVTNTHDVLWIESDYAEGLTAIAWLPREVLSGSELYDALLTTYWQCDKEKNETDQPNFTEVLETRDATLSPKQVLDLAKRIWPEF
jgi:hypothetical protein